MSDTHTEVMRQGWGSRLGGSFKGIITGLIVVVAAFFLLFWNEGRAVKRHKALKEGGKAVVSVGASSVAPANEGKLIHLSGMAETTEMLRDADFGVAANAIHLERKVEMYQWMEKSQSKTEKKLGGGTETTTTYSYSKGWSERAFDSSSFKKPVGHANPGSMPYSSRTFSAQNVTLGAFRLSPSQIGRLSGWSPVEVRSAGMVRGDLQPRTQLHKGGLYVGSNSASPQVGDLRISFRRVDPAVVSIVAAQQGSSFGPYPVRTGSIDLLRQGSATADEMIEAAKQANKVTSWILRVIGFFLMTLGLGKILKPFSVMADVLPVLGNLVEKGTGAIAFALAIPLALGTIAFAWLFYRPLLAIGIFVLAAGGIYLVVRMVKKAKFRVAAAAPVPPPPHHESVILE